MSVIWGKSSLTSSNGNCVEVARLPGGTVGLRNSRNPERPVLQFTPGEWHAFIEGMRFGEFDSYGRTASSARAGRTRDLAFLPDDLRDPYRRRTSGATLRVAGPEATRLLPALRIGQTEHGDTFYAYHAPLGLDVSPRLQSRSILIITGGPPLSAVASSSGTKPPESSQTR